MSDGFDGTQAAQRAREALAAKRMARFYKAVSVAQGPGEGSWQVHLDGRPLRTPLKKPLAVPTRALADAVAEEWAAQEKHIRPETMPLMKLAGTAVDKVSGPGRAEVIAILLGYANADVLAYRADHPDSLCALQTRLWDPLLDWVHEAHGARFRLAEGIMPLEQPREVVAALEAGFAALDDWQLTAAQSTGALTGSLVLALALGSGQVGAAQAFDAAQADETWQMGRWGADAEAEARRADLQRDLAAAERLVSLSRTP